MRRFMKLFISMLMLPVLGLTAASCGGNGKPKDDKTPSSNLPNYVNPEEAAYAFGASETVTPFYTGNVIYNESVLLIKATTEKRSANFNSNRSGFCP